MDREKPTPCDKVMLPVYFTTNTSKGLRVCKDFFAETQVIALRWYNDNGRMIHTVVRNPGKYYNGENYWNVSKGWLY